MSKLLPFKWNPSTDSYEARCPDCRSLAGVVTIEFLRQADRKPPFHMEHYCLTERHPVISQNFGPNPDEYQPTSEPYSPFKDEGWKSTSDGTTRIVYEPVSEPEVYPTSEGRKVIWQAAGFLAVLMIIALAGAVFFTLNQKPAAEVTPDQGFVSSVRAGTTKLASIKDQELIDLGHKACTARRQGMTKEETLLNVASASADRTLRNDLAYTIGAAYTAYCPEYTR